MIGREAVMKKDLLFYTGTEDFPEVINDGAYYVDKTSYLKDLFLSGSVKNPLFIRPRRFGKTLNMSMIEEFCKLNYENPGDKSYQYKLFIDNGRNLAVAGDDYKELREKIMGEFPVVKISFKTVEGTCFQQAVGQLIYKVGLLYNDFSFLTASSKQSSGSIQNFKDALDFCDTKKDYLDDPQNLSTAVSILGTAIPKLGEMLYKEFGRKVIVIIDEYDVPLQKAVIAREPYYDDMLNIIRTISGNTFKKDNLPWLYKGIVSGCLRIAHQSVFTDANNFTTYGMNVDPYTGFFGFTKEETKKLLSDCDLSDKESEVQSWYDGYHFGKREIFCPWSLISYCNEALYGDTDDPQAFWINTSGNDIITMFAQNSIAAHDVGNVDKLQKFSEGEVIEITPQEFSTYPDISNNMDVDVFMTMMLHTGYATYAEDVASNAEKVKIRIPNNEVTIGVNKKFSALYSKNNLHWFNQALNLVDLLIENKAEEAKTLISSMLKEFLSIRNTGHELYYHGFMAGVLALASTSKDVEFHEEIESGDGFPDIVLKKDSAETVTVLEFKKGENDRLSRIKSAEYALDQILKKKYAEPYIKEQYKNVYAIGIGFGGKECYVQSLGNLAVNKD